MIGARYPLVADVAVGAHTLGHVVLTIVVERLVEFFWCAPDVAEMDEVDLVLLPEVADNAGQVLGHQPEVALAQTDAVGRTGNQVDHLLVVVNAADDAGHALNRRQRRIVRMHGEPDTSWFGDGHDSLEEVFQVVPLTLFADLTVFVRRGVPFKLLEIESGHFRPATSWRLFGRANDEVDGHPGRAPHRNANGSHVADELAGDLDLLVAPRLPQHRLLTRRPRFDHGQLVAVALVCRFGSGQRLAAVWLVVVVDIEIRFRRETEEADGVLDAAHSTESRLGIGFRAKAEGDFHGRVLPGRMV